MSIFCHLLYYLISTVRLITEFLLYSPTVPQTPHFTLIVSFSIIKSKIIFYRKIRGAEPGTPFYQFNRQISIKHLKSSKSPLKI